MFEPAADGWEPEMHERAQRDEAALAMGGPEAVQKQHDRGKHTARERIAMLLDQDSFRETGRLVGKGVYAENGSLTSFTPSNSIIGKGTIEGRRVVVSADDFTVAAGSSEASNSGKWVFGERWALDHRVPLIRLVDSAGGSIRLLEQNGATKIPGYPSWPMAEMMGAIPIVGVAMGPCAGLGAVKVVSSHFSIMVRETSQVFAAGPHVVTPGVGETVSKDELGGYRVHARGSGVVDNDAVDEADALAQVRRFLSYLPANAHSIADRMPCEDPVDRRDERLATVIPRQRRTVYAVRDMLKMVLDQSSTFELGRYNGRSAVTMLARLNGYPVGVLASDPVHVGGALTAKSAEKIIRFIDLCDTFHLPIVNFVDQPGLHVGTAAESAGTLRAAVRWRQAIAQSRVPWSPVFVRRAFGVGGGGYAPFDSMEPRLAWPSAHWGSIPIEGGVQAAFRRDIAESADPSARQEELYDHFRRYESPLRSAERFTIEDVIDPRDTRVRLCEFVEDAYERLPAQVGIVRHSMRS